MRIRLSVLAIATWAAAAPAAARTVTYGSTLRATPDIAEAHGSDTAFWPVVSAGDRVIRAPATGRITRIRVKGSVLRSQGHAPLDRVHFQHLRPLTHGRMRVLQSTPAFHLPIGGPRDAITGFRPENLCVRKGDVIDFEDEGGFVPGLFPHGSPFRVFARVAGATTARFTGTTTNGAALVPGLRADEELLMQLTLGTGSQVGGACRAFNRG